MTTSEDTVRNHRRQQALLAVGTLLALVLAIVPRQERALFIMDEAGVRAFVAAVPPPPIDIGALARLPALFDGVVPRGFFVRTPRRPAGSVPESGTPGDGFATSGTPFAPDGPPIGSDVADAGPAQLVQNAAVPAFGQAPGSSFPFLPVGLTPPGASPVAAINDGTGTQPPVATPSPVVTPTPVVAPTPVPSPTAVVVPTPDVTPAVPEPTTWALMILGFFAIGSVLRRGRAARGDGPELSW